MINLLMRLFIKITLLVSILVFLISLALIGLNFFINEDAGEKIPALINEQFTDLTLSYDDAEVSFSLQGLHAKVNNLRLNTGSHRLDSAEANIWWLGEAVKISLLRPRIIIDDLTAKNSTLPTLPIEISASDADISIPALSLTLTRTEALFAADSQRWLFNSTANTDGQYLHLRAGSRDWRQIRLYAEIDNFPLPLQLPLTWSRLQATVVADIGETIAYQARGRVRNLYAAQESVSLAAAEWQSEGSLRGDDDLHLTVAFSGSDLATASGQTVNTITAIAAGRLQREAWTLQQARLYLHNPGITLTASFAGKGALRPHCSPAPSCINNALINYSVAASAPLPDAPTVTARIGGAGEWRQTDGGWQLQTRQLQLAADKTTLHLNATVEYQTAPAAFTVDGLAAGTVLVGALPHYFPPGKLRQWFIDSLPSGVFTQAAFNIRSDGDFSAEQTTLKVTAAFSDGEILIADGWQPAQQLQGTLVLDDDDISIRGAGVFDGLAVPTITAYLGDINAEEITLSLDIRSAAAALEDYAAVARRTPPTRDYMREADDSFSITKGRGRLSLAITMPLSQPQTAQTDADLALQHAAVKVPQLPDYESVKGNVRFNNQGITGALVGKLVNDRLEAPQVTVRFNNTTVSVSGAADVALLLSVAGFENAPLTGNAPFVISRSEMLTVFSTTFEETVIDMPYPLGKSKYTPVSLEVKLINNTITARYTNEHITINVLHNNRGSDIAINAAAAVPATGGVNLHGDISGLDLDLWLSQPLATPAAGGNYFSTIQLTLNDVDFMGNHNDYFIIRGGQASAETPLSINLDTSGAVGNIVFFDGALQGDFSYLHIPVASKSPGDKDDLFTATAITANVATLAVGDFVLGSMALAGAPDGDKWRLQQLAVHNNQVTLEIGGSYEKQHTYITVHLNVAQLPALLTILNIQPVFGSGRMSVFGSIAWPGTPIDFDLEKMEGRLRLLAQEVQYLDIAVGTEIVNFLAIFSPQSLFSLGFTELNQGGGIIFDTVQGDIALASGAAKLQPVNLLSSDLRMDIQGTTNYLYHQHNLFGKVYPGEKLLNAGSAVGLGGQILVAGAGLANPASLVAAPLLGKFFEKPISEIGSYDYTITGTWKDPVYEENKGGSGGEENNADNNTTAQ